MNQFYGDIGFIQIVETAPGVWQEQITERKYYGNIIKNQLKWKDTDNQNNDITIENRISILADTFAFEQASYMRYVKMMGAAWKITLIEVRRPRLILTIGGVYNVPTGGTP